MGSRLADQGFIVGFRMEGRGAGILGRFQTNHGLGDGVRLANRCAPSSGFLGSFGKGACVRG